MTIRRILILILALIPLLSTGQRTISDCIHLDELQNGKIKTISLFIIKNDNKTLVEKIDLNGEGLILKKTNYCNFLYTPLDSIEIEIFEYDYSDTLLISHRYENENGDTLRRFGYTYEFDSEGILLKKGIEDFKYNDFEQEQYFFNESGLLIKERSNFYNDTKDTIRHYIDWIYKYDKSGNCINKSFAPTGIIEFERVYEYSAFNKVTNYKTIGIHQGGHDIDRYTITYNSDSQKILEEIWNASGENWAFSYKYDKTGKLIGETKKTRYVKRKFRRKKASELPPPPPFYTQDMLEKKYTDEYKYNYFYDSEEKLSKVTETFVKFKLKTDYIIEYKTTNR